MAAFNDLQTHSGIVIRTLPEARLVVNKVRPCRFVTAPKPFSPLAVNNMLTGILPTALGNIQCFGIAKMLIKVNMPNNALAHYPPLSLRIDLTAIGPAFVHHSSIMLQSLVGSASNVNNGFFYPLEQRWLPQL